MPIRDQDQGGVTLAIAATFCDGDQLLHVGGRQVLPPLLGIGRLTGTVRFWLFGATTLKRGSPLCWRRPSASATPSLAAPTVSMATQCVLLRRIMFRPLMKMYAGLHRSVLVR